MVPTFGMFDFLPVRLARAEADDRERQEYLGEVRRNSTQFGAHEAEGQAHADACLRMAMLLNRF
ncbi:hypothetical protein [Uliginosibacterium gangwonense]|jgi:hypothetical protein|uniref:hypothetical protein n=1 Tax=Uliginosibacterium gangwonense TaxID=392736 RepID=UPI00035EEBA2|nr:hypothetical protein [Uliginosibacterium gangwonense]